MPFGKLTQWAAQNSVSGASVHSYALNSVICIVQCVLLLVYNLI